MNKNQNRRTSKIDYTLMRRRQVIDFLEAIKQMPDLTPFEADEKMEELIQMGPHVPSVLLDLLHRCDDDETIEIITYALEYLGDEEIVEPLIDIFVDAETSEKVKLRLLSTLASYGIDTRDPEFAEIFEEAFDDIEAVMAQSTEEMLVAMQNSDEAITFLLENYQEFPPQAKMELVTQFGERKDARAVSLLKVLAVLGEPQIAEAAISYLGKIKSPLALAALSEIIAEIQDAALKQAAEKSARRLRLMEVQPPRLTENPPDGEIYKIILSFFDGTGSRILAFSRYVGTDKSHVESVNLMLKSGIGLADCYGSKSLSGVEFDEAVEALQEEVGGSEIRYEYGLLLLKDALWQNRENAQPVPPTFVLWKSFFRDADISPEPYILRWAELVPNFEAIRSNLDLLEESYELHECDEFMNWLDQSPETYHYAEQLEALMDRYHGRRLEREIDRLLKRYARDVFEPQRERIRRDLEYAADCLFRQVALDPDEIEEDKTVEAEIALAAALHLGKQSITPLDEHPFIIRMMEESLENAVLDDRTTERWDDGVIGR